MLGHFRPVCVNRISMFGNAYIIDGWQRVGNALRFLKDQPNRQIRMRACIHFGTDLTWEKDRFEKLNKNARRVSPNKLLSNMATGNLAIGALLRLSSSSEFALHKRVSWGQSMEKGDLITALTLAKIAMVIHSQSGGMESGNHEKLAAALNRAAESISLGIFRRNVISFFDLINENWPFAAIEYRIKAPQIKGTFLHMVARLFSRHPCFWDSDQRILSVSADDRRKLAKFPLNDGHIAELAGSSGQSRNILYRLLVDHMNSGRQRQNRLKSRFGEE